MKAERPLRALGVFLALSAPMWLWSPASFFTDAPLADRPSPTQAADATVSRAIRAQGPRGALVDWSAEPGFGESFVATRRVGAFNPLDAARVLVRPERSAPWRAALLLLVAGWTAYRLMRLLGLLRTPALFGALSWSMHGAFATGLFEPSLRVAALTPAAIWMAERLLRRPEGSRAAALAFVIALIGLADHPETAVVVVGATIAWGMIRSITAGAALGGRHRSMRAAGWLVVAIALGVAVAWPQIAPQWTSPLPATGSPLAVADWLASAAPLAFERAGFGFVGVAPLFAAAIAILAGGWADRRVRAFGLLLVAGIAGAATTDWTEGTTAVAALAVAGLAALGIQRCWPLFGPPAVTDRRLRVAAALAITPLGIAGATWVAANPDTPIADLWRDGGLAPLVAYLALGLATLAAIHTTCHRVRAPWTGRAWRFAPIALVLLELGLHGAVDHAPRPPLAAAPRPPRALLVDTDAGVTRCATEMPASGTIEVRLPARSNPGTVVFATAADDGWNVDVGSILVARRDASPSFLRANVAAGPPTTVTVRHRAPALGSRFAVSAAALALTILLSLVGLRRGRGGATLPEPRPYLWLAGDPHTESDPGPEPD